MAIQTAGATFNGSQDSVAVVWPTPFASVPIVAHGVGITDAQGGVSVDVISPTTTGCTVETSARFNGTVSLIASG